MTPERWHRITEIFHSVLEQPPSQADEFLQGACGDDAELHAQVQEMLQEHARSGFLDREPPGVEPGAETATAPPVFSAGQTVSARYRIVRFLNRGGMGEVYEAEDLELKERVALKTLLPAIAADTRMIARFKQEIQLSRKISHPNVCRVFDLARHPVDGSSPETVFFLTMEFLPGETLAARLDREERLSPVAALPLIEQMGEALDAAHRSGIIHRDFKPSNVMLTPDEAGVRAVVTDFGLARSFGPSRRESTATAPGRVMGTLDYMAPELLTGRAASIASDVYALGMVAYRMVTGALPFPSDTPLAGAILRSRMPVPSPKSLAPDLDAKWERTILRALDPEPARRFERASDFAGSLRGESTGVTVSLPVMTRRRWIVAAVTVLVLVGGGVGWREWKHVRNRPSPEAAMLYQKGVDDIHAGAYFAATKALGEAVRVAPHFGLAHARLAEAWLELDTPEKASQQMILAQREDTSDFANLDRLQIEAVGFTVTREFDEAVRSYEHMHRIAAEDADLDVDLGRAFEKAGQPVKAIESYRHAAEGSSHNPAAWLRLAIIHSLASDSSAAAEAFQQAEQLYQLTNNLEGLTEVAVQRGVAANNRGQYPGAAAYLGKALEFARLAGNIQQEIRAKQHIGVSAYNSGDATLAEKCARESLETAQENQMEGLAIRGVIILGQACALKRDFAGAEKYYRDALGLARRSSSLHLTADALFSLASIHDQLKSPEAIPEAREALAFFEPNRYASESLKCLTMIGRAQRYGGNYSAALDSFQELLRRAEQVQDRLQMGLAHESIAAVLFNQELYPKALEHYQKSLELYPDDAHRGYAALGCGEVLWLLGRYAEARTRFDGVDATAARFPTMRLYLIQYRAEMSLSRNLYTEAAVNARSALVSEAGHNPLNVAEFSRILGLSHLAAGNRAEGLRNCEESFGVIQKLNDLGASLRCRLALLQARIEANKHTAGTALFRETEPMLAEHPESRWRALAWMATADRQYAGPAREALDDLAHRWGDEAFRTYLTRPDVQKLSWHLLHPTSANQ